ncbi:MAG: RNA methyltransferase [Chitinophagaceae bacterium]
MFTRKSMDDLQRVAAAENQNAPKFPLILILDDVRSMQNVGSAFRTADAFAITALYLCGYTPQPPHRDIHKTALGATETVTWKHFSGVAEAIAAARDEGYQVVSVEQAHNSVSLNAATADFLERPTALIFGNEVSGVSDTALTASDACIEIPQYGSKHSLNITVSLGIVVWEFVRRKSIS